METETSSSATTTTTTTMAEETNSKNSNTPELEEILNKSKYTTDLSYTHEYFWPLVIAHIIMQVSWIIGIYNTIFYAQWKTLLWSIVVGFFGTESVALGAHRAFTHKSFKMTKPLKIAIVVLHTMAGQNSVFTWVRDHKCHHKYADSDGDPHNSQRGFFFSHMGWLMVKKNKLLRRLQREIDVSELKSDPIIMFQHKYFVPMYIVIGMIIPIGVPMYFWNETLWSSVFTAYFFQYVTTLHMTWTINSFAHKFGTRPYDGRLQAVNSKISWVSTIGDGWHNFHHAFPWDSRMAEFGQYDGISNAVLKILVRLGLAYDVKFVSPNVLYGHMKRHGAVIEENDLKNSQFYDNSFLDKILG